MLSPTARVCVIDDDPQVREMLLRQLKLERLNVDCFACAEDFLASRLESRDPPTCILLDLRLSGMDGLALQKRLAVEGKQLPIIFITGFPEVSMVVRAIKMGAFDVLEKPFRRETLLEKIEAAIAASANTQRMRAKRTAVDARAGSLSPREHEVFGLLLAAKSTKQIGSELNISEKTVAKHRVRVLQKLRVDSVVELVRVAARDSE